jgi:hypothetical protein
VIDDDECGAVGGMKIGRGNTSFFLSSKASFAPYFLIPNYITSETEKLL